MNPMLHARLPRVALTLRNRFPTSPRTVAHIFLGLVLEAYDGMATAMTKGGNAWQPRADVAAGEGPRHADAQQHDGCS